MFKIGDRVKLHGWGTYKTSFSDGLKVDFLQTLVGTVKVIQDSEEYSIGVEFDIENDNFHNCQGYCTDKRGQWFTETDLITEDGYKKLSISERLLNIFSKWRPDSLENIVSLGEIDFLDIAVSDLTKISYIKKDRKDRFTDLWDHDQREKFATMIKPTRILSKILLKEYVEKLTSEDNEKLLAIFQENDIGYELIEVYGKDIKKYYHEKTYEDKSGTLNESCMRYGNCQEYFDIYVENTKMLIKINKETKKICGRAIIWKCKMNEKDIILVDRIYGDDIVVAQFKNYAIKNKYAYKVRQSYSDHDIMYDGILYNEDENNLLFEMKRSYKFMPYIDTFQYQSLTNPKQLTSRSIDYNNERSLHNADGNFLLLCKKCGKIINNTLFGVEETICSDCKKEEKRKRNKRFETNYDYTPIFNTTINFRDSFQARPRHPLAQRRA